MYALTRKDIALPLLCLLPISFLVRAYIRRVKLDRVLRELEYTAMKLRETSPSKQKKWRIIKARYDNLSNILGVPPPYSPFRLSWAPFSIIGIAGVDEWYVTDLFLYLAVVGIFNTLHNRISGLGVLYGM
jgi:hypothetical protein